MPRLTPEQVRSFAERHEYLAKKRVRLAKVAELEKAVFEAHVRALPRELREQMRRQRRTVVGRFDVKERVERLTEEGVDEYYDAIERQILARLRGPHSG